MKFFYQLLLLAALLLSSCGDSSRDDISRDDVAIDEGRQAIEFVDSLNGYKIILPDGFETADYPGGKSQEFFKARYVNHDTKQIVEIYYWNEKALNSLIKVYYVYVWNQSLVTGFLGEKDDPRLERKFYCFNGNMESIIYSNPADSTDNRAIFRKAILKEGEKLAFGEHLRVDKVAGMIGLYLESPTTDFFDYFNLNGMIKPLDYTPSEQATGSDAKTDRVQAEDGSISAEQTSVEPDNEEQDKPTFWGEMKKWLLNILIYGLPAIVVMVMIAYFVNGLKVAGFVTLGIFLLIEILLWAFVDSFSFYCIIGTFFIGCLMGAGILKFEDVFG